jgi:hypothetical protein
MQPTPTSAACNPRVTAMGRFAILDSSPTSSATTSATPATRRQKSEREPVHSIARKGANEGEGS